MRRASSNTSESIFFLSSLFTSISTTRHYLFLIIYIYVCMVSNLILTRPPSSREPGFIPPKKPYSLPLILRDILHFASETLIDGGRCSFWMPTANDEEQELPVPAHPCLELVVICVQPFNRWSRRLLTYRKRADDDVDLAELHAWLRVGDEEREHQQASGTTADELNPFRKGYFSKFQKEATSAS